MVIDMCVLGMGREETGDGKGGNWGREGKELGMVTDMCFTWDGSICFEDSCMYGLDRRKEYYG